MNTFIGQLMIDYKQYFRVIQTVPTKWTAFHMSLVIWQKLMSISQRFVFLCVDHKFPHFTHGSKTRLIMLRPLAASRPTSWNFLAYADDSFYFHFVSSVYPRCERYRPIKKRQHFRISIWSFRVSLSQWLTLSLPIPLRLYALWYWSNPPFLISDIRALWRSGLSARAPECQKLKTVG